MVKAGTGRKAVWVAALGCAFGLTAQAFELTPAMASQLSPGLVAKLAKARAARQMTAPVAKTPTLIDHTAPTITAFDAEPEVDLHRAGAQLVVNLTVTDDMAGLDDITVVATGPSGRQIVYTTLPSRFGRLKFAGLVALNLSPYAEQGVWSVDHVHGTDAAGNYFYLEHDALAALGNASFTVKNSLRSDVVPPTLAAGQILTTKLSISSPARGTESHAPFARANVRVQEAADAGPTSGASRAYVFLCLQSGVDCFSMSGVGSGVLRDRQLVVGTGTTLKADQTPGDYIVQAVGVADNAGNWVDYYGPMMGGNTDFSSYFPSTTLTIVP